MNKRDHRGWRIPRKGTKCSELYDFLAAGYSAREISDLYGEGRNPIGVLCHNIKNPESHNKRANEFYDRHFKETGRSQKRYKNGQRPKNYYSPFVKKLVRAMGISHTEAVEMEKELDAKDTS